jgi:hypothetical protein
MSEWMLAAAALLLVFLTFRASSWSLTRPVTMPGILYVARFRMSLPLLVGAVAGFGAIALILGRLIVFLVQSLALAYVVTIDAYGSQLMFYVCVVVMATALCVLYLSLFPRKLIVFSDHIRIKFLAYRSRVIKREDLLTLSTRRMHQVWFRKDLFRCVPLTLGLVGPGIYLQPTKGRAYFFRTRDTQELIDVLGGWRGSSVVASVSQQPRRKKKEATRDHFQEAQETTDWIASMAPDSVPEKKSAPATIASIAPDSVPEKKSAPMTIASMDPDSVLKDAGVAGSGKTGMGEDEIQELLGESYKRDVDKKF